MEQDFPAVRTIKQWSSVFVSKHHDDTIWMSIQIADGSANVTMTREQAQTLIDQLTILVSSLPVAQ